MKILLATVLTLGLFAASNALGCDKTKGKDTEKTKTTSVDKEKKVQTASADQKGGTLMTGSYIKHNIRRSGQITDGPNQVLVLDQKAVSESGASDLRQLLSRQGVH
jgi:hypothetical protein